MQRRRCRTVVHRHGEGANLAVYDGADLAREIAGQPGVEIAPAAYEQRLLITR